MSDPVLHIEAENVTVNETGRPDYPARLQLRGRAFVVLGAGQGIGQAAAHAVSDAGGRVVCVDTEPDRAHSVAGEVGGVAWVGDATNRASVEALLAHATDAMGPISGLIDVIGMSRYGSLLDIDDAEWEWHQMIVLRHAWLALQVFGRAMAETGGGTMAFVASVSGITGAAMHAPYGAAKAALMSLVRSAAVELGPRGIRVNAVAPGLVWTPRISEYLGETGYQRNIENTPLAEVARPADIASALLFLSSEMSAVITGQTLVVDGGVGAKFPYPPPEQA